jgi:hypothetical protein
MREPLPTPTLEPRVRRCTYGQENVPVTGQFFPGCVTGRILLRALAARGNRDQRESPAPLLPTGPSQ